MLVKTVVEHWLIDAILFDLCVPDQAQRHVNGMYLLKNKMWMPLADNTNDPKRVSRSYLAYYSVRNPDHYAAMMLIEAVEIGAMLVSQRLCDQWTASVISWMVFTIKAPFYLREENYERIIMPIEFQELINRWLRTISKDQSKAIPAIGAQHNGKWELISDLVARISHRLALDSIKRMWRDWRKETDLNMRLQGIIQLWSYGNCIDLASISET